MAWAGMDRAVQAVERFGGVGVCAATSGPGAAELRSVLHCDIATGDYVSDGTRRLG
jgi:hypothetical protein